MNIFVEKTSKNADQIASSAINLARPRAEPVPEAGRRRVAPSPAVALNS